MALSLSNSFKAGDAIVLAGWDTNFDEIEAETNAFPTAGAIGAGVVHEVDIAQRAVTPDKIENDIQFLNLPKCKTIALADLDANFTDNDHLVSLLYTQSRKSAVFADGDFTAGEILIDADTASSQQKMTLPNGRILIFGYEQCLHSAGGSKTDTVTLTGLSAVYDAFAIAIGDKATYGINSELSMVVTGLTTTLLSVNLYIRSYASGVGIYGYCYFVIGK
jgi:hypothetical protein